MPAFDLKHPVSVALSPRLPAEAHTFFGMLSRADMGVATFTQSACIHQAISAGKAPDASCQQQDLFDPALQTAEWALRKTLDETSGPIALLAHSRGGLIARELLNRYGDAGGRIKWVITLNSPHGGTSVVRAVDDLQASTGAVSPAFLPASTRRSIKTAIDAELAGIVQAAVLPGARELSPDAVPARVLKGEVAVPGVRYLTIAGTSTTQLRVHVRTLTQPVTIEVISLGGFEEMTNGKGDLFVAERSARLQHLKARHLVFPVHHSEVLWYDPAIIKVREFLNEP